MLVKQHHDKEPTLAAAKATVDEILALRSRLHQAGADFLKIDVDFALTFTGIALQTDNAIKRQRNCRVARKAYDTLLTLVLRVNLSCDDARIFGDKMQQLKSDLIRLGEVL